MHGEERQVDADESDPEVQLAEAFLVLPAAHLGEPIVETCKHPEQRPHGEHVVELGDNIVGVVQDDIDAGVGQHDTRKPAKDRKSTRLNSSHSCASRLPYPALIK